MSFGGPACGSGLRSAVDYASQRGVSLVAAAGNQATSTPQCPAAFPSVLAVSGTDIHDGDSDFSNFGSWVDIAAPGGDPGPPSQNILSTLPTWMGSYDYRAGTSMSSPFVAGVASLLASQGRAASSIRGRIEGTAIDLGARGKDLVFGHGLVDAEAAVDDVRPITSLSAHPKRRSRGRFATFRFSANEAGSIFQCSLDRRAWTRCSSPKTYRPTQGRHTFRVRAIDRVGNVDTTPASWSWRRIK